MEGGEGVTRRWTHFDGERRTPASVRRAGGVRCFRCVCGYQLSHFITSQIMPMSISMTATVK